VLIRGALLWTARNTTRTASRPQAAAARSGAGVWVSGLTSWTRSPVGSVASRLMPMAAISRKALSVVGLAVSEVSSRRTLEASRPARSASARLVMPCCSRVVSSTVSRALRERRAWTRLACSTRSGSDSSALTALWWADCLDIA
jgi:hypothetical protein